MANFGMHLRNDATGEVRVCEDAWPDDDRAPSEVLDDIVFLWIWGNFSSNGNRQMVFAKAGREEEPDHEEEFTLLKIVDLATGLKVDDGDGAPRVIAGHP